MISLDNNSNPHYFFIEKINKDKYQYFTKNEKIFFDIFKNLEKIFIYHLLNKIFNSKLYPFDSPIVHAYKA